MQPTDTRLIDTADLEAGTALDYHESGSVFGAWIAANHLEFFGRHQLRDDVVQRFRIVYIPSRELIQEAP